MDNRGIATAELLFTTLIFVIIVGSLISSIGSELDKTQTGDLGKARMLGEKIAETINTVYINGNGYSANLTMPNDFNYTTYVYNNGNISIVYNSKNITIKLIPQTNIQPKTLTKGQTYNVKNNGTIYIV